ncbi:mRNA capping enzyme-domain-containing protein [Schizophyllum fasciatum]
MPAFDPVRDALRSPVSPSQAPSSPFARAHDAAHYSSSSPLASPSVGLFSPSPAAHANGRPPPPLPPVAPESPERTSRPASSHGTMAPPPPPPPPPRRAYQPKRLTPAGSVMIPLSQAELQQFQHFRGRGALSLSKRKRRASAEPEDDDDDKPPAKKLVGDPGVVAAHYNARPEVGVDKRVESPIFALKAFNNWIKSVIITKFAHPALQHSPNYSRKDRQRGKVLDLGCGKGGDINKWQKANAKDYIGADIAAVSVQQGRQRHESLRGPRPEAHFFALDCFSESLRDALPSELLRKPFDVVSMQFCMHYAFETEAKARCMLGNVSDYLRPGGVFVGTIPNADFLLDHLRELPAEKDELCWGNSVYSVKFDSREHDSIYGHRYWFYLQDAVDNVPEYLVHWEPFVELAAEYGLSLVYKDEFQGVFRDNHESKEFGQLLIRMKVVDENMESNMTEDQWDAVSNVYAAFAFEKR